MEDGLHLIPSAKLHGAQVLAGPVVDGDLVVPAAFVRALAHQIVIAIRVDALVELAALDFEGHVLDCFELIVEVQQVALLLHSGDVHFVLPVVGQGRDADEAPGALVACTFCAPREGQGDGPFYGEGRRVHQGDLLVTVRPVGDGHFLRVRIVGDAASVAHVQDGRDVHDLHGLHVDFRQFALVDVSVVQDEPSQIAVCRTALERVVLLHLLLGSAAEFELLAVGLRHADDDGFLVVPRVA